MISFSHVSKEYTRGHKVLDDITLDIRNGEFVFIIGKSGAGKSTIMKLITREEKPTQGLVSFYDEKKGQRVDIASYRPEIYRRKLGIVFQSFELIPHKNVFENIAYPMQVLGESPRKITRAVNEAMRNVGVFHLKNKKPGDMSGGEQQRVAIARALVNRPSLILADEPTGNLDPETALEIMGLLSDINKAGTTIIMVTHNRDAVRSMGRGRLVYILNGKIENDVPVARGW